MKKTMIMALAMVVLSFVVAEPVLSDTVVKDLYAGQNFYVGTVTIEHNGDLIVTYDIDEEACGDLELLETHLHVATDPADIPQTKKGNPKIGKFDYSGQEQFVIPLADIPADPGDTLYIAAHAVVGNECCEICASADLSIEVSATFDCCGINGESFFEVIITEGTDCIVEGTYHGWCADIDHSLSRGELGFYDHLTELLLKVYSTCSDEPLPDEILADYGQAGGITFPGNLDMVNWILNNIAAGDLVDNDGVACDGEAYTYGDIQGAIWTLLEGSTFAEIAAESGIGAVSECRIGEIVGLAETYGVGFKPGCCEVVAVILAPIPLPEEETPDIETRQLILIPVPAPCCETAWGDAQEGIQFSEDNGWATYFSHLLDD